MPPPLSHVNDSCSVALVHGGEESWCQVSPVRSGRTLRQCKQIPGSKYITVLDRDRSAEVALVCQKICERLRNSAAHVKLGSVAKSPPEHQRATKVANHNNNMAPLEFVVALLNSLPGTLYSSQANCCRRRAEAIKYGYQLRSDSCYTSSEATPTSSPNGGRIHITNRVKDGIRQSLNGLLKQAGVAALWKLFIQPTFPPWNPGNVSFPRTPPPLPPL